MFNGRVSVTRARMGMVGAGLLVIVGCGAIATPANAAEAQLSSVSQSVSSVSVQAASTYTYYFSRSDVERMYTTLQRTGAICKVIPLPYPMGAFCGAPPAALKEALSKAHYQKKRIKAVYHSNGYDWNSYYTYSVIK